MGADMRNMIAKVEPVWPGSLWAQRDTVYVVCRYVDGWCLCRPRRKGAALEKRFICQLPSMNAGTADGRVTEWPSMRYRLHLATARFPFQRWLPGTRPRLHGIVVGNITTLGSLSLSPALGRGRGRVF